MKQITLCESAEEALDKLSGMTESFPDIFFVDINLVKMDGWEFIDQVNLLYPTKAGKCVFVILSVSQDNKDKDKAANHPLISGFYEKPLQLNDLNQIIDQVGNPPI